MLWLWPAARASTQFEYSVPVWVSGMLVVSLQKR
jgi:hypothetical protein